MRSMAPIVLLLAPIGVSSNPVLDNLDFVNYMADLSEACRSEVRIKGERDLVCWILEQQVPEKIELCYCRISPPFRFI